MSAIAAVVGGGEATRRLEELARGRDGLTPRVLAAGIGGVAGAGAGVTVASANGVVAVVHGTVYRRDALRPALSDRWRARLDGPDALRAASPAELFLAVYDRGGADALASIDGEFAFALWDEQAHRLLCGRDFIGFHALHVAEAGGAFVVATSAEAIRAHFGCHHRLDLPAIGATIAGLFNVEAGTGTTGVRELRVGELLVYERSGRQTSRALWTIPEPDADAARLGFDDAAVELRSRIQDAVAERLAPEGRTGVWLSGGWDSSAVFASGVRALGGDSGRDLVPVSMSYPEGDPGREDELIAVAAAAHGRSPRWCLIGDTPLLPQRPRAGRDGVFAHAFEEWNRALARATRTLPSSVALIGMGGDELFSGTTIYLADLLRRGRLPTLAHQWYRERGRTLHRFPELVLRPALTRVASSIGWVPPWRLWSEADLPAWIRADFVRDHALRDRERALAPRPHGDLADAQVDWLLSAPFFTRVRGTLAAAVAAEGVQLRAPLFDRRVIAFARARPRWERVSDGQTKRLLRHAMRGSLPESFLAPRARRTGVMTAYLVNGMRDAGASAGAPVLAELGLVDPAALGAAWDGFRASGGSLNALALFHTYAAERWVRQQLGVEDSALDAPRARHASDSASDVRTPRDLAAILAAGPAGRSAQLPRSSEGR